MQTTPSTAPLFIVGSPRSGTTLLYHMLLSTGDFVCYRTETHVFTTLVPYCGDLTSRAARERLLDVWLGSVMLRLSKLDAHALRDRIDEFHDGGSFLQMIMGMMAELQGVPRWADSTPAHLLHMREISRSLPDALFVHVVRDGRDVALSLEKLKWVDRLPWDRRRPLYAAGAAWDWWVREGARQARELGPRYCEIRYEQLVEEPHVALRELGSFIGHELDYDQILRSPVGSVERPNTSFPNAGGSFIGRWKTALSAKERRSLEATLRMGLDEFGYTHSGNSILGARLHARMYDAYFALRQALKNRTPLGRRLTDLSLFAANPRDAYSGD